MPSIRITRFAGLLPEVNPKALANDHAQVAHNCLLWDGFLRPMPQWRLDQVISGGPASLFKYAPSTNGYDYDATFSSAFRNLTEPFNINYPIGIGGLGALTSSLGYGGVSLGGFRYLGCPTPSLSGVSQSITSNNLSTPPISRTYAITYSAGNAEGPPTVLPQIGTGGTLFEGDNVTINFTANPSDLFNYGVTRINIYRTIPGFDTSEQLGNPLETGFHLAGTIGFSGFVTNFSFVDSFLSQNIQGDLLISDQWVAPPNTLGEGSISFGQTEGGWAVNARYDGTFGAAPCAVDISERYMHSAWPPQNRMVLPEVITGMAIFYDDIFIGTQSVPYYIHVAAGDGDALSLAPKPFINEYACIAGTMIATNFGAMYVAKDGLIALTAEGDAVASKRVANPGDLILNVGVSPSLPFRFYDAQATAWWDGNFFGFTPHGGYIYNQPNPSNQEFPLGQHVTIDLPGSTPGPNVTTGFGLFAAWGNSIYTLPLPGYGYETASYLPYTWKSKRYVMPGLTTFGGAKVVGLQSTGSPLTITFNGYNAGGETSPSFVFSRSLSHSNPFRIPHQHKCLEWEIEVTGKAAVQEIHLATSFRDLTESANGD